VTPYLRLVDSKSAPRSSSRTTLSLRLADHRRLPLRGNSRPASVALGAPSADPELSGLVLDLQHLQKADQCPTKSWGEDEDPSSKASKARSAHWINSISILTRSHCIRQARHSWICASSEAAFVLGNLPSQYSSAVSSVRGQANVTAASLMWQWDGSQKSLRKIHIAHGNNSVSSQRPPSGWAPT